MPGYALLPTTERPVSTKTYRLTNEEMQERNEWILGAHARGETLEAIAYEVGLSKQRVQQIIKPSKKKSRSFCTASAPVRRIDHLQGHTYTIIPEGTNVKTLSDEDLFDAWWPYLILYLDGRGNTWVDKVIEELERRGLSTRYPPNEERPLYARYHVYWIATSWNAKDTKTHQQTFTDEGEANAFCELLKNVLDPKDEYYIGCEKELYITPK